MIGEAKSWLKMFQTTEAKLLGRGEEPDFKAVLAAMAKTEPSLPKSWTYILALAIVAGALSVLVFVVIKPRFTAKS